VRSGAYKHNQAVLGSVIELVGQQEITPNMALAMTCPVAAERMIEPFGA